MKIIISRQELKTAMLFVSKDESRFVLNGINLEVGPKKQPKLIATDGRRLVVIETLAIQEEEFTIDASVILAPNFVKPIIALSKSLGAETFPWISLELRPTSKRVQVALVGPKVVLDLEEGALVEGQYPNWRQVIPAKDQRREPIKEIGVNSEFVGDFAKAAKFLELDSPIVQMNLVGKDGQIEVKLNGAQNFYGLVMQCKLDDSVEYQPEFLEISKAFPKPSESEADEEDGCEEMGRKQTDRVAA